YRHPFPGKPAHIFSRNIYFLHSRIILTFLRQKSNNPAFGLVKSRLGLPARGGTKEKRKIFKENHGKPTSILHLNSIP
ncbi:hypothetical protein KJ618_00705, partial [Patescibacteria group bacterium]|nr:hypothetical protein [Patescibacteria group bacterium]